MNTLPKNVKDIRGQRFGKLTVVEFLRTEKGHSVWFCRCDCGGEKVVARNCLKRKSGRGVGSCGCMVGNYYIKHGYSGSPTYETWRSMKRRCYEPSFVSWEHYGGRGITVCDRWLNSFENFLADMGPRPKGKTIDRKNPNGNYHPKNCCWATAKKQARNRRRNRMITIKGQSLCIAEWAEVMGINEGTISSRLKAGWPEELAVKSPIGTRVNHFKG